MSGTKRLGNYQGTPDDPFGSNLPEGDAPQKATAAQLAKRK